MPCDDCERCLIDPCGYQPAYWDEWTDCGTEYNASCEGFIQGNPGDYMILSCKQRLGIFWLFNEPESRDMIEELGLVL